MNVEFVMTKAFDESWAAMGLDDADLAALQSLLMLDPETGDVVPNTGGIRKVRVPASGRGKRGGARVIYVNVLVQERIYLLLAYPKNEQTDLTAQQLKTLRGLVRMLKR